MALPNFFVVGAQKAGTTSLHHYLAKHPNICLPKQKETKFFVDDSLYDKGIEYYESNYFSNCGAKTVVGEVDPDYMYFPIAVERIKRHVVRMLRDGEDLRRGSLRRLQVSTSFTCHGFPRAGSGSLTSHRAGRDFSRFVALLLRVNVKHTLIHAPPVIRNHSLNGQRLTEFQFETC